MTFWFRFAKSFLKKKEAGCADPLVPDSPLLDCMRLYHGIADPLQKCSSAMFLAGVAGSLIDMNNCSLRF